MKICIIGSGVVGKATGDTFIKNNEVTFNDNSHNVLKQLHYHGFTVGDNTPLVVAESDVVFICVNTPTYDDGEQDLSQVLSVIPDIIRGIITSKTFMKTIILRSTVIPNEVPKILQGMKDALGKDKKYQRDWDFFYNPEFLVAENAFETMSNPDRVVVGSELYSNWHHVDKLYANFDCPIIKTGLKEAGMIKYGANCFLATKISFFNELGRISKSLQLNVTDVENGIALDKRIGSYGTKSGKPFAGKCFPKDIKTFCKNYNHSITKKTMEVNDDV